MTILSEPIWRARQLAHEARVGAWTQPHSERARRGERHPVYDFLFEYYRFKPALLRRWHPGLNVILQGEGAKEFLRFTGYCETSDGVSVDAGFLKPERRESVRWLLGMLQACAERPAFFGCFGLHEWAMVYRSPASDLRHPRWPLRFHADELARIVESLSIRCTHFDAFRFFTPAARPLNRAHPARETSWMHEQRGCLHANMDLYKWAFKLAPFSPSELVADAFELARAIREVDMRASPYDFTELGFEPIRIETAEGRALYENLQRGFAERSTPIRERLILLCEKLLASRVFHTSVEEISF
jgi:hypothetical protein